MGAILIIVGLVCLPIIIVGSLTTLYTTRFRRARIPDIEMAAGNHSNYTDQDPIPVSGSHDSWPLRRDDGHVSPTHLTESAIELQPLRSSDKAHGRYVRFADADDHKDNHASSAQGVSSSAVPGPIVQAPEPVVARASSTGQHRYDVSRKSDVEVREQMPRHEGLGKIEEKNEAAEHVGHESNDGHHQAGIHEEIGQGSRYYDISDDDEFEEMGKRPAYMDAEQAYDASGRRLFGFATLRHLSDAGPSTMMPDQGVSSGVSMGGASQQMRRSSGVTPRTLTDMAIIAEKLRSIKADREQREHWEQMEQIRQMEQVEQMEQMEQREQREHKGSRKGKEPMVYEESDEE